MSTTARDGRAERVAANLAEARERLARVTKAAPVETIADAVRRFVEGRA